MTTAQTIVLLNNISTPTNNRMEPSSSNNARWLDLDPLKIVLRLRTAAERRNVRIFAKQLLYHLNKHNEISSAQGVAPSTRTATFSVHNHEEDHVSQCDRASRPSPRHQQNGTLTLQRQSDPTTPAIAVSATDSSSCSGATPSPTSHKKRKSSTAAIPSALFSPLRRSAVFHASSPPHCRQETDTESTTPFVLKRSESMLEADDLVRQQQELQGTQQTAAPRRISSPTAAMVPAAATPATQTVTHEPMTSTIACCSPVQPHASAAAVVRATVTPKDKVTAASPTVFNLLMANSKLQFCATPAKKKRNDGPPPPPEEERLAPIDFIIRDDGTMRVLMISEAAHRPLSATGAKPPCPLTINMVCRKNQQEANGGGGKKQNQRPSPVVTFDMLLYCCMAEKNHASSATSLTRQRRSWLKHQPQLSCAELKSLLQQHVRSMRPFSSVRIAMALADRSLLTLLCYLPVLTLQETVLHPDLAVVVWLALEKLHGDECFVCPEFLIMRVFRFVYEVASCPQQNDLLVPDADIAIQGKSWKREATNIIPTIASLADLYENREVLMEASPKSFVLLWSMLLHEDRLASTPEERYTLRDSIQVWTRRFWLAHDGTNVPPGNYEWNMTNRDGAVAQSWYDVPEHVHADARKISMSNVSAICAERLDSLLECDTKGVLDCKM